jgi:precorrin-8X/cobalt-precorrin-8 methylmutase
MVTDQFIHVEPADIEATSMAIIDSELPHELDPAHAPIIKRVIHATADFDYADTLTFSDGVVPQAHDALRRGATIITDTMMAKAGINGAALATLGCRTHCYMADPATAARALADGMTRAAAAMARAVELPGETVFVIGNAPTALLQLYELMRAGSLNPALIVGVPVGFVNVIPAKELIMTTSTPHIVNRGRKGGSNVAAAIINALMYELTRP